MVAGIGILLGSVIGVNIFDYYRRRKTRPASRAQPTERSRGSLTRRTNIIESKESINRHFTISLISLGLATLTKFLPVLNPLSLAFIVYTCLPILKRGQRQLLERRTIGHDLLYSAYIIMAFLTRQQTYIALGVFFYHTGAKILAMNQAHSKPIVTHLVEQQADKIWVVRKGVEIEVAFAGVSVGDVVVVRAGEIIPVDGVIVEGMAVIDQHTLTGESEFIEKEKGQPVFASTLVVGGRIQVKVTKSGNQTVISEIEKILRNTSAYATSIQLKGEKWADYIAIPIAGLTVVTLPVKGLLAATTVIHSTFGNRLRIAAPITTLNYLHAAFRRGILIKDGRVIEEMNEVDTVLFDKTGTLTHEEPKAGRIVCAGDRYGADEILTYAATAEHRLTHPIARAIINRARESRLDLPSIDDSSITMGYGITATIADKVVRVGSARFMEREGMEIPPIIANRIEQSRVEGTSLVLVAIGSEVAGAIEIVSVLRPEVETILKGLRRRGVKHISIVSGDHKNPTRRLAESLGLDSYHYEVLPQEKAMIVERLQQQGRKVCYVGDGINDTIAMNTANVSVSLRGATTIATDTAQVVLMDGTLTHLCDLFDIAHDLRNSLWRSLTLVTIPSVISIGGAVFWGMTLGCSYLIIYSSFALALANAMLPKLQYREGKGREIPRKRSSMRSDGVE